nr:hypothetical protein [Lachnospiraceae bacterium]
MTKYSYDANGNNTKITDAKNNYVSMKYNEIDLLSEKISNGKLYEKYDYDALGNLVSFINSKYGVTTYKNNNAGLPTRKVVTSYSTGESYAEIYGYDNLGRLKKVSYPD